MRDLVYYVASTLDGFIAREDGSFEDFPWDPVFGAALLERYPETFPVAFRDGEVRAEDNQRFDSVIMGRKTYEVGVRQSLTNPYPTLKQYVVSESWDASPDPAVTLISTDPVPFVTDLKAEDGAAIWVCGGGQLASSLFAAGLVDELVIKLNPVVFGRGIPLFAGPLDPTRLELLEEESFSSGHVLLRYRVSAAE